MKQSNSTTREPRAEKQNTGKQANNKEKSVQDSKSPEQNKQPSQKEKPSWAAYYLMSAMAVGIILLILKVIGLI